MLLLTGLLRLKNKIKEPENKQESLFLLAIIYFSQCDHFLLTGIP